MSLTQDTMKTIATNLHLGLGAWVINLGKLESQLLSMDGMHGLHGS